MSGNISKNIDEKELIAGLLLFLTIFFLVAGSRWYRLWDKTNLRFDDHRSVYLREDVRLPVLTAKLDALNILTDVEEFLWAARLLGWNRFRRGHYRLEEGMTYNAVLSKMARGLQDPVKVTVPPGISREKLYEVVAEEMAFEDSTFRRSFEDSLMLQRKGWSLQELFGRMLPNTYKFYWTAPPKKVIRHILDVFHKEIAEHYNERLNELENYTLNDIITLASIIEWEAANEKEKPIISGLYWNRLRRGMYLQADPTVLYAIDKKRRLYYKDYRVDHPYNTYQHRGLPPGPVTNPSKSSIQAAFYPEDHDYLFMVASPDGTHDFSETFSEHKRKSQKWRKWIREQYRIKREREAQESSENDTVKSNRSK